MMINDNSAIVYWGDSGGDFCGDFNSNFCEEFGSGFYAQIQ